MTTLERSRPADGTLTAERVVLAHNVWAAGMPEFRRTIAAISSDMAITAPIRERLDAINWTGDECMSDSQMTICYYRTIGDGRIAFGKGGATVAFGGRITPGFDHSARRAREVASNSTAATRSWPTFRSSRAGAARSIDRSPDCLMSIRCVPVGARA